MSKERFLMSEDTHFVGLNLDKDMHDRLKAVAKREERSLAAQIRYMLKLAEEQLAAKENKCTSS